MHLCRNHEASQRRACSVLSVDRSSIRYRPSRPDDADQAAGAGGNPAPLRLSTPLVLLRRDGTQINHKNLRRLYAEERLQVKRRGGRKRALGTRALLAVPQGPNQRWSLDFLSDAFTDGRRFRILAVVDDCTRECLTLVADTSLSGTGVARELDAMTS